MKISSSPVFDVYAAIYTDDYIFVKGRALKTTLRSPNYNTGLFNSLVSTIRLALSKELKNLPLVLNINGENYPSKTDKEGYFEWTVAYSSPANKETPTVELKTLEPDNEAVAINLKKFRGELSVGIISDIDDTVLLTHVNSFFKLRMIFNTIFINPFKRKPIESAAKFYSKYLATIQGEAPIIYISNSPWNMYHYLDSFLVHNAFPSGILLLRDFGLQMLQKKKPLEFQNKYLLIVQMITLFPKTKFILIGDSAEADFDIYMKVKYKYPENISRIIIRKAGNPKNESRILQSLNAESNEFVEVIESFGDDIKFDS